MPGLPVLPNDLTSRCISRGGQKHILNALPSPAYMTLHLERRAESAPPTTGTAYMLPCPMALSSTVTSGMVGICCMADLSAVT